MDEDEEHRIERVGLFDFVRGLGKHRGELLALEDAVQSAQHLGGALLGVSPQTIDTANKPFWTSVNRGFDLFTGAKAPKQHADPDVAALHHASSSAAAPHADHSAQLAQDAKDLAALFSSSSSASSSVH